MKNLFVIFFIVLLAGCTPNPPELKDGDIIFHKSMSSRSNLIEYATNSKYTHVGIIYKQNNKLLVYEATGPIVQFTPLSDWIKRGENNHYVVKRLKDRDKLLTSDVIQSMKKIGSRYRGKPYDAMYGWSDDKMYCSELVWKIYKYGAGIELGQPRLLEDFNIHNPKVKRALSKAFNGQVPLKEKVVPPSTIFDSDKLMCVLVER